jgi:hypothetical protein
MAFTETDIAAYTQEVEKHFWSERRPPLHLRNQIREGLRIEGQSIDLFFIRPAFNRPDEFVEEAIARITYIRTRELWRIFWMRADGKWHRYPPCPETGSLKKALQIVRKDDHHCFFG